MLMSNTEEDSPVQDVDILITAAEAYPEMERAFLEAREEIWASYRVFDLWTKLRSPEARAIGDTWFDLIVHVLRKGVVIHMVLSDFDPVAAQDLHCASWQARRAFVAAREIAGPEAKLHVVNAIHSAKVGVVPRQVFWPWVQKHLRDIVHKLNTCNPDIREAELNCSPGIRSLVNRRDDGTLVARMWPPAHLAPASHHQKIAVFDRERLCIGGLDLDERRYDDKGHHRRRDETWHDVQLFCRGPVVEEAQAHVENFLLRVAGLWDENKDRKERNPDSHFLVTVSRRKRGSWRHLSPEPCERTILDKHLELIGRAERLIYLESQFFRDTGFARALAEAGRAKPDLGLVLVLPAAPDVVAFEGATGSDARYGEYLQAKCVSMVQEAFGDRLALCSPVRPKAIDKTGRDVLCGSPIVYVHAKVSLFDESEAIVSSANLNARSLHWDTEAGVLLDSPDTVQRLKRRAFDHWLGEATQDGALHDPATAARAWRDLAEANAKLEPEAREGLIVPYDPQPAREFGRRLPGVPEGMV